MKKAKFLSVAGLTIALGLLAGCTDKKIDGSSDENFKKSAQAVLESLPDDKKSMFSAALMRGKTLKLRDEGKSFAQSLDGKTGEEVIAYVVEGQNRKSIEGW